MGTKTYQELVAELVGYVPNLNPFLAETIINRAWSDVRDSRQWSFNQQEGVYFAPAAISTGTIAVTQGSATATCSSAAATALGSLTNPVISLRQIRFSGGALYGIVSLVGTTLTLDRIYQETTAAAATYSCYRAIYGYPQDSTGAAVTDFVRFNSIRNPQYNYWFVELQGAQKKLDLIDPMRVAAGLPNRLYGYKADSSGNLQFEMYPHPTSQYIFMVNYQKKGSDLSATTDTLPVIIPDSVVMERAMQYACEWASGQIGKFPQLRGVNWMLKADQHRLRYSNPAPTPTMPLGLLEQAIRQDEERSNQNELITTEDLWNSDYYPNDPRFGYFSITP